MSIPSTTWWPSRNIPPRFSKTLGTGCPGITRAVYLSTIPDEPAPPNILNQTLPTAPQPGGLGNVCLPASPPANFFPLYKLAGRTRQRNYTSESTELHLPVPEDG